MPSRYDLRGWWARISSKICWKRKPKSNVELVTMEVSRQERIAKNEAVLRDVNDNIRAAIGQQSNDGHVFEFLCECADPRCMKWVELTVAEYEEIRADGNQAAVGGKAGGGEPADEHVGAMGAAAETHDPRAA